MYSIKTIAYILIKNKKVLLVRARSKNAFYMPGGKPDPGETSIQALIREIREEIGLDLKEKSLTFFGIFEAQAYGKEKGVMVKIECYLGKHSQTPTALAEIEEVRFFSSDEYLAMPETAPAVRLIIKALKTKGYII